MTIHPRTIFNALLIALPTVALAAEEREQWSETFPVGAAPQVVVSNVWGDVRVRRGQSGQVQVQASERRWAPSDEKLELSRELLWLEVNVTDREVRLEVGGDERHHRTRPGCRGCRLEIQFHLQVPADATLRVSTVNDGVVEVRDIAGPVSASNVNGPVTVQHLHDCEQIRSVNGPLKLDFSAQPQRDCQLETINGDITANLPPDAGLDLAIDLFNGRIFSGLDLAPVALPASVTRQEKGNGVRYQIKKAASLRIGAGGPRFEIESMNGDVHIGRSSE